MMTIKFPESLRVTFLLICFCGLHSAVAATYSGGSGTAADPYRIATAADLIVLGETPADYDKHFILTADIDLDPNLPGRRVFDTAVIPCGEADFTGVFDGKGHTISSLTIRGPTTYLGLFGVLWIGAEVRDIALLRVNMDGSGGDVGALAGLNNGTVTRCYSTGSIHGTQEVGGLVGYNFTEGTIGYCSSSASVDGSGELGGLAGTNGGVIAHCYSTSAVIGSGFVGGLIGLNGGVLTDCHSTGAITGSVAVGGLVGENMGEVNRCRSTSAVYGDEDVGGLVGRNISGSVSNCYSTGGVTGDGCVGGLVGLNYADNPTISKSYSTASVIGNTDVGGLVGGGAPSQVNRCVWDLDRSGVTHSVGGIGLRTPEMMDPGVLALQGFGADPNWLLDGGKDYPRLAWEGKPGVIIPEPVITWFTGAGTAEDPYQIENAGQLLRVGRYGVLWDRHFVLNTDIDLDPKLPGGGVFGEAVIPGFGGSLDGNGHAVLRLTISGENFLGLVGGLAGGSQIRNLGVVDTNITGSGYCIGALVGSNDRGDVINCYSTGTVRGGTSVGGLVGYNSEQGAVIDCHSAGVVDGERSVGGLVGENSGGVDQCSSAGAVTGDSAVGGLAGQNSPVGRGTVSRCFSTASVAGTSQAGGLVGVNSGWGIGGSVSQCYSTGLVRGGTSAGGLIGENSADVTACFWDTQTSGKANMCGVQSKEGRGCNDEYGRTTAQMQNRQVYLEAGWDFVGETANGTSEVWEMPEKGGYPVLAISCGYKPRQLQGSGRPQDPYLVSDAFDLGAVLHHGPHACYRVTASIELSGIRWGTAPIPWFAGKFDGNGRSISRLTIQAGGHVGLFGELAGTAEVKALAIVDVNIIGSGSCVGGLAGLSQGRVTQCSSTGTVKGGRYVGGLIGANGGNVVQCYSRAAVQGDFGIGGLLGGNELSDQQGEASQCYSTGAVRGYQSVGGLIGYRYHDLVSSWMSDCFWDMQTTGQATSAGGKGKTTTEMRRARTFLDAGWDFVGETANGTEDIWWIDEGRDYPRLRWELGGEAKPNP